MKNFIEVTSHNTNEKVLVNIDYIIEIYSVDNVVVIKQFIYKSRKGYEFLPVKDSMEKIKAKLNQIN